MQRLEIGGELRQLYGSLGFKGLKVTQYKRYDLTAVNRPFCTTLTAFVQ